MSVPAASLAVYHERVREEMARRSLLNFILHTKPDYQAGWFHRDICRRLDKFLADVKSGKRPRLIIQAPPRHGKTEIVSRRFPAYALGKDPDLSFIATSYAADLASMNNRDVQRVMDDDRYRRIFPATSLWASNVRTVAQGTWMRNSDIFEVVGRRGVYRSAGVCGGITGMGASIAIIDDPIKDDVEANSEVYRERVWNWYTSTLYTRLAPLSGVLLIMTRWHDDDLVGRLLRAADRGEGDKFEVCRYPAIAEKDERHRKEGEALHPERYSREMLVGEDGQGGIRKAVGSRVWVSLFQQRPSAAGGTIFKEKDWRYYKPTTDERVKLIADLGITSVVQAWDTAFKIKTSNDYCAGLTIGVAPSRFYLLDMVWRRMEYPELKRAVMAAYAKWNPSAVIIEDTAAGQSVIQELKRETRVPVLPWPADKDKVSRANAITPQHEAGLLYLPEGAGWVMDFVDECSSFPNGAHDDQVDALTIGMGYLVRGGGGVGLLEFYRQAAEEAKRKRDEAGAPRPA